MKHAPARRALGRTPRIQRFVGWAARKRSRGQAIVEFAILIPILLLLLVIAIDFGRAFFTFIQLNNAAREGAAYAAGNPTDSAPGGGIWTAATLEKNSQGQGGEGTLALAVSCARGQSGFPVPSASPMACADAAGGAGPGNTVTVSLSEPFSFITPLVNDLVGTSFTLRASATAAVLGLAASGGSGPGGCTAGPSVAAFSVSANGNDVTVDASASQPSTGINAITGYNWDWGDGTDPYLQEGVQFTHKYAGGPPWTITLTVENPCGRLSWQIHGPGAHAHAVGEPERVPDALADAIAHADPQADHPADPVEPGMQRRPELHLDQRQEGVQLPGECHRAAGTDAMALGLR